MRTLMCAPTPSVTGLSFLSWTRFLTGFLMLFADALFHILIECGGTFSVSLWTIIFSGVLRPIFDNARMQGVLTAAENEWLSSTCLPAFQYLVKLFHHFFVRVCFLLPDYLALLVSCIMVEANETLSQYGASSLLSLIMDNQQLWTTEQWHVIARALLHIFKTSSVALVPPEAVESLIQELSASEPDNELTKVSCSRVLFCVALFAHINPQRLERAAPVSPAPSTADLKVFVFVSSLISPSQSASMQRSRLGVLLVLIRVVGNIVSEAYPRLAPADTLILLDCLRYSYVLSRHGATLSDKPAKSDKLYVRCEVESLARTFELLSKGAGGDGELEKVTLDLLVEMGDLRTTDAKDLRRAAFVQLTLTVLGIVAQWPQDRMRVLGQRLAEPLMALVRDPHEGVRDALAVALVAMWRAR